MSETKIDRCPCCGGGLDYDGGDVSSVHVQSWCTCRSCEFGCRVEDLPRIAFMPENWRETVLQAAHYIEQDAAAIAPSSMRNSLLGFSARLRALLGKGGE